jgi:ABC-type nickel/cobalt efflux system permease component RcnA
MNTQAVLALAWLFGSLSLVMAFGYFLVWRDDRAERRKAHRAAE